ncbi:MAG TPA: serine hydrolase, partial [Amycolatopsis sp.]|nr:serine hydrolase [Amycolatopsis sp.]
MPPLASPPPVPQPDIAEYLGRYRTGDLAFVVSDRDGALWAPLIADIEDFPAPPPFEAVFVDGDAIAPASDPRKPTARFLRNDHGEVTSVEAVAG